MTTKYEMWMTYNSEAEKIQFPVLPETFSVKNGSNNDSVDITGLGEIVIMQSRPAVQISFSSFFPGSYHYDITLKEYREITTRQVKVDIGNSSATVDKSDARVDNTVTPKTYTVKSGDCLWNIAKALYGNGADYTKIYNANKGTIGKNPNLIYPGQTFTIP